MCWCVLYIYRVSRSIRGLSVLVEDNALIYEVQLIPKDTACAAKVVGMRMYDLSQNG